MNEIRDPKVIVPIITLYPPHKRIVQDTALIVNVINESILLVNIICELETLYSLSSAFSYDTEMIFKNAKVDFRKGNVYYICGQSGVGKSTFLQLISGQLRNYKGTICYNSSNLKLIDSKNIADLVSVVTQESVLFNDSIINNIVLDKDIDYERVEYLCKICNIFDYIEELPDKFDTIVSEKGDSFSGGQKSRLCLVRALYKKAPILIIDEVTAGLDGITERNIKENLSDVVKDKIVIIVTHSSNFIINNSIIYNIENYRIKQGDPKCLK